MGTGIKVVQKTVEGLFQLPIQYIYKVPEYQRPFSWNKDTAEEFITDMLSSHEFDEGGLFIGAFIFVDNKKDIKTPNTKNRKEKNIILTFFCHK